LIIQVKVGDAMNNKIQERLKKIKALADRGIGGEKETAQRMYRELLDKYSLTEEDILKSEENVTRRWFKSEDELSRRLAVQIAYKVTGDNSYWVKTNTKVRTLGFDMTDFEYDEFKFYYNFYINHFRDELDVFYKAFININDLFPDESARCYEDREDNRELTPEELDKLQRMFEMQRGMHKKEPNKQIEDISRFIEEKESK
jgi:hypothetical protein